MPLIHEERSHLGSVYVDEGRQLLDLCVSICDELITVGKCSHCGAGVIINHLYIGGRGYVPHYQCLAKLADDEYVVNHGWSLDPFLEVF